MRSRVVNGRWCLARLIAGVVVEWSFLPQAFKEVWLVLMVSGASHKAVGASSQSSPWFPCGYSEALRCCRAQVRSAWGCAPPICRCGGGGRPPTLVTGVPRADSPACIRVRSSPSEGRSSHPLPLPELRHMPSLSNHLSPLSSYFLSFYRRCSDFSRDVRFLGDPSALLVSLRTYPAEGSD